MTGPAPIRFTPLVEADLPRLQAWLARPHVAAWWQPTPTLDELRNDYLPPEGAPPQAQAFIAREEGAGGSPIGFIQCYRVMGCGDGWWPDETDPGARGIDQFLVDGDRLGQGMGRAMIRAFVEALFQDPAVTTVQTDPDPANLRALRCYRAAGFVDVGPVVTPDGVARLMRCSRQDLARAVRPSGGPSSRPARSPA